MNALTIIMLLCSVPVIATIITISIVVKDAKAEKLINRFDTAMQNCIKAHGWEVTHRLLDRYANGHLPLEQRAEALERFANKKD